MEDGLIREKYDPTKLTNLLNDFKNLKETSRALMRIKSLDETSKSNLQKAINAAFNQYQSGLPIKQIMATLMREASAIRDQKSAGLFGNFAQVPELSKIIDKVNKNNFDFS